MCLLRGGEIFHESISHSLNALSSHFHWSDMLQHVCFMFLLFSFHINQFVIDVATDLCLNAGSHSFMKSRHRQHNMTPAKRKVKQICHSSVDVVIL